MEFSVKLTAFQPQIRQVLCYELKTSVLDGLVCRRKSQEWCTRSLQCRSIYIDKIKTALETCIKEHRAATGW